MYADPCEHFGRWYVRCGRVRFDVRGELIAARRLVDVGRRGGEGVQPKPKDFDPVPRYRRPTSDVVAYGTKTTTQHVRNFGDRKTIGQFKKVGETAVSRS